MAKKAGAVTARKTVMECLIAIKEFRTSICDTREKMYQRALTAYQNQALSQDDLAKASLDLDEAKIKLAEAEKDILKENEGGPTSG